MTLKTKLADAVASSTAELEDFKAQLDKNAAFALEWSNNLFEIVAKGQVAATYLAYYERMEASGKTEPEVEEALREHAVKEALRMATYPNHSTSPTANLMATYTLAAHARVADAIGRGWL